MVTLAHMLKPYVDNLSAHIIGPYVDNLPAHMLGPYVDNLSAHMLGPYVDNLSSRIHVLQSPPYVWGMPLQRLPRSRVRALARIVDPQISTQSRVSYNAQMLDRFGIAMHERSAL